MPLSPSPASMRPGRTIQRRTRAARSRGSVRAIGLSATGSSVPGTGTGTGTAHRRRQALLLGLIELGQAVSWPLTAVLVAIGPLLPVSITLVAEAQRLLARCAGADAPSGRWREEPWPRWAAGRVATAPFWRQDLPLALVAVLAGIASMLAGLLALLAVLFLLMPISAATSGGFTVEIGSTRLTEPWQLWWTPLVALVMGMCAAMMLGGIGLLRTSAVSALSRDREAERAAALGRQVGDLRRGRATLVDAFEAERTRIERDLHDGAQQRLTALTLTLGSARLAAQSLTSPRPAPDRSSHATARRGAPAGPGAAQGPHGSGTPGSVEGLESLLAQIDRAQELAETALGELRATVRSVSPATLRDHGLLAGVRELCADSGLDVALTASGEDCALPSPTATAIYFAISESLTNAARHSGCGRAWVSLSCSPTGVRAEVGDTGVGGAPGAPGLTGKPAGTGLAGLAQRLETVGGSLEVVSPPGQGTRVIIRAPMTLPW
ncbi:sensor histidine kinase [Actinomyces bowdenii]|uniref:sensor histidine kinase n=1 Tax=Actinomyces bowdenii TaxID=131109 RepID=UPI001ABBEA99|nr:histidine kinase [Actinomyces bowdenii]MBO3723632.1 sensor histidine kinase [Actinomyces bowdenii]